MGVIFGRRRMDDIPGVAPYAPVSAIDGPVDPYAAPYSKPGGEVGTMVTPGSNPLAANKPSVGPQRRGVFGRLGAYFTPDRLSLLGAAFSNGGAGFADEQSRQLQTRRWADADWRNNRQAKFEDMDAETVRSGRQRFRGTLTDPAAQAAFDVNPAPFIDAAAPPSETFSAPRIINGRLGQENERTHEVQWAPQRIGAGGSGAGGVGGAAGWSDNAIDAAATQMLENGGRVPPNLRNQAAIARVWSRYSELLNAQGRGAEGQVARQASVAASQRGLVTVRARRALMEPAERAANRELQLVQQLSTRVGLSNSPFWNRPINAWGDRAAGNPDLIAFRNAALSAATEYARVLSGSTGASGITDSAREEAESMINVNMSPAQIVAATETMRLGMSYKNEELLEEERQFLEDLGQAPQNGPASTALPDIRGRHAGRSNRVPTYNPATGRIE